ncbi:MAG: hypothetical protein IKL53_02975 [Lachnospiraceae bacterium]|nr:hypothetical protein [Lachnospiraceae bacterium]
MALLDIDKSTDLTADVYGINSYVNRIKQQFTPDVNEDTLLLGIFGYAGQMFSDTIQNTIVMASEFSNESIPTKAKFEKNVIAHALGLGISDINATPAQLDVLLTFIEDDIIRWANAKDADGNDKPWEFIFDKDTPIYIGDYCFHTDYDIRIRKVKLENLGVDNKFAYTAMYIMDDDDNRNYDNPISDITNPYLTPPVKIFVNGMNLIFTKCTIRQVKKSVQYKKILSDNSISAKTFTFEFDGQLAAFNIEVTEGSKVTHMVPVYDGLNVEVRKYPYFYYNYLDSNTIRVKFDRYQYQPRINSEVRVNIWTTEGKGGNFTFDPDVYPGYAFESEHYEYSNIGCEIRPVTGDSAYGIDKKSIEDLKKLIPKEALSRGSITNIADLENYFNMLDTELSKLYFYKKRDNALERLYYCFMVMKDVYNSIIPTNTINLKVRADQLQTEENSYKLVFKKGQMIRLIDDFGYLYEPQDGKVPDYGASFYYIIPYSFIINLSPLYGMYYLSTIDAKKFLDFTYINDQCLYQYVSTFINWKRGYFDVHNEETGEDKQTYELSIEMAQNIEDYIQMINYDDEGNIESVNIKVIAVFYNEKDEPHRWAEASLVTCDPATNFFKFKFSFTTEDYIDAENRIRIDTGLYDIGTDIESYAHFAHNVKCVIHIASIQDNLTELNGLDELLPKGYLDGYVVSNSYTVAEGIDWFYDYSEIIESIIVHEEVLPPEEEEEDLEEVPEDGTIKEDTPTEDGKENPSDEETDIEDTEGEEEETTQCPCFEYCTHCSENCTNENCPHFNPETGDLVDDGMIPIDVQFPVGTKYFRIMSVPVVKADYFDNEDKVLDFCQELVSRKNYIDYAMQVLEDAFGMDFKFFNTYGPSKLFTLNNELDYVNHTNLTLTFNLKLRANHDSNITNDIISDIKAYIENINEISSLHMPNLITEITTKYKDSIVFFEFVDMNGYGPGEQHLYSMQMPDKVITPEFLNIYTRPDGTPDIVLNLM